MIYIKRIYVPASADDGIRILVDRLWPRGLTKEQAQINHWLKHVAPSTALRKWFGHQAARWEVFQRRYHAELLKPTDDLSSLCILSDMGDITLLTASRSETHNHAIVLRDFLQQRSCEK